MHLQFSLSFFWFFFEYQHFDVLTSKVANSGKQILDSWILVFFSFHTYFHVASDKFWWHLPHARSIHQNQPFPHTQGIKHQPSHSTKQENMIIIYVILNGRKLTLYTVGTTVLCEWAWRHFQCWKCISWMFGT